MFKKKLAVIVLTVTALAVLGLFYLFVRSTTPPSAPVARYPLEDQAPTRPTLVQPIIASADPALGPATAAYTIVNFSDFRCPYCVGVARDLRLLQQKFPAKVRLVWKDFPFLPPRETSRQLHEAARCAGAQSKFWEYHDWLFSKSSLGGLSEAELTGQARTLNLDVNKFSVCLGSSAMKATVERNFEEGRRLGIDGTPYLFLNGEKVESVEEIINQIRL